MTGFLRSIIRRFAAAALVSTARAAWNGAWRAMVTELAPQDGGGAYERPPSSFPLVGGPAALGGPAARHGP